MARKPMTNRLVDAKELARVARVSPAMIYKYAQSDDFPKRTVPVKGKPYDDEYRFPLKRALAAIRARRERARKLQQLGPENRFMYEYDGTLEDVLREMK